MTKVTKYRGVGDEIGEVRWCQIMESIVCTCVLHKKYIGVSPVNISCLQYYLST